LRTTPAQHDGDKGPDISRSNLVRLGVLAVLWGSGFLWVKLALRGLSPTQIVLGQLVAGALVLLAGVLLGSAHGLPRSPASWAHLAVMATTANIVPYLLYGWAQQHVPSSLAGALNATTPLFTFLLAVVTGSERPSLTRALGVVIGFAGVVVLAAPGGGSVGSLWGVAACLLAPACFAVSYVYARCFLTSRGSPLALAAAQLSAGAVLLGVLAPLVARQPPTLTPIVIVSVLALGVFSTAIAYVLNYRLIQDEGATAASTASYLVPVVAVVLGVLVTGEPVTWNLLFGAAIVLVGVAVLEGRLASAVTVLVNGRQTSAGLCRPTCTSPRARIRRGPPQAAPTREDPDSPLGDESGGG
jgi:drug/metabolite transporter (DMT)-like permease